MTAVLGKNKNCFQLPPDFAGNTHYVCGLIAYTYHLNLSRTRIDFGNQIFKCHHAQELVFRCEVQCLFIDNLLASK